MTVTIVRSGPSGDARARAGLDQLAYLTGPVEPDSYEAKLRQRLDGRRVLAYSADPANAKHFARTLGASRPFEVRTAPAFSLNALSAKIAAQ